MSNPYELRFQILEMARDHVMQSYYDQYNYWQELHAKVDAAIDDGRLESSTILDRIDLMKPVMPSAAEIKQKASELYEFVERKPFKS